ncbi:MAG: F0F1 ATP synthase subunit A [Candidatus Pacebacteria bacterium]|nr:F0F1 ATP synthase subunit A [Candidatus Paceibacterota bacterium]
MELEHTTTESEIHTEEATTTSHTEAVSTAIPHEAAAGGHELKHEQTLYAEPILHTGPITITNALITSWATVGIIIVIALILRLSIKKIPGKLQHAFEVLIDGGMNLMDQVTNDRNITRKVFPIAISIFFFILISNWIGLLPLVGLGIIEHGDTFVPFLRSGTADLNTTIALAVTSVIGANIFGIFSIGAWKMLNKYINLKILGTIFTKIRKDPVTILVAPITFAVGIIEIVGEGAKIASLSLRLFGNVFAGEVLLASMTAMIAYLVPIPFLFLEVFVGIIQAFIFSILTVVYFTIAAQDHDHDEEHDHGEHADEHGAHVLDEIPGDAVEERKVGVGA